MSLHKASVACRCSGPRAGRPSLPGGCMAMPAVSSFDGLTRATPPHRCTCEPGGPLAVQAVAAAAAMSHTVKEAADLVSGAGHQADGLPCVPWHD